MKKAEPDMEKPANAEHAEAELPVEPGTLTPEQLDELKARAAKADEHCN